MNTNSFPADPNAAVAGAGGVAAFDPVLAMFTAAGFDFEVVAECPGPCASCATSDARAA